MYDVTLRLIRTKLCSCGYDLMDTPVGTLYRAISTSKSSGILICGGCHKRISVTLIQAEDKRQGPAWLVLDVMEVVPDRKEDSPPP